MWTRSSATEGSPPSRMTLATCATLTALAYLLLARLNLLFKAEPENIAVTWFPNGMLLGVMLVRERRDWRWLLASGCAANLIANFWGGNSLLMSLGFAGVNGIETWLAAWATTRHSGMPLSLTRLRELFGLVAVAAIPACACAGLFGAALVKLVAPEASFWSIWRLWLVADVLGLLLIAPIPVAWCASGAMLVRLMSRGRWLEAIGSIFLLVAATVTVSQQPTNSIWAMFVNPYLVMPILLWLALRHGALGASLGSLAVSLVAVWFLTHGMGPFAQPDRSMTVQILALQLQLFLMVVANLLIVAVQAERTHAREQVELVIRGTDAGIWDWNLLTNEVYQSPRWKSMLGYEDHELPSGFEAWESRVHPEDHSRALATFRGYLSGKLPKYELEHRLRHKDGTYRWVLSRGLVVRDSAGRSLRITGSHLDITASKQAEEALRESERHFRAAFDDSPIGMNFVNRQGRFERVNDAYCRLVGYSREQLLGKKLLDITHPDDIARGLEAIRQFAAGERRTYQVENRYVHADGHIVWAFLNVTLVVDAQGQPLHFFGQIQDITQLKQDEIELRRQAQELERSNQELDDFAYIASHDLKTPLRGIDNLSKWIADDSASTLSEASREHLRKLRQRIARLDRLLDDLLQYSRAGHHLGDLLPIQTGPLVRSIVELLNPPPGFVVNVANGMPLLKTHKAPLELVFRNLIDNAIKHHDRAEGRIEVSAVVRLRFVEFTVRDDGPGISDDYHERVFRMFQTLKPRDETEGSGIGLAVVKKVVERQGGQVTIESRGRGATFRFTWPN